jgi:hypothetical protein
LESSPTIHAESATESVSLIFQPHLEAFFGLIRRYCVENFGLRRVILVKVSIDASSSHFADVDIFAPLVKLFFVESEPLLIV